MTLKEKAEKIFNQLDEESLEFFIFTFEDPYSKGNARKLTYGEQIDLLFAKSEELKESEE